MMLNRDKMLLDRKSSISSDLERCSLHTDAGEHRSRVTVEKLEKENAKLKMQYEDLRSQYMQLLEEAKEEKFEERRINLLKAQVLQLERQVILLSEGLSSQLCRSQDVEKALDPLTQRLRTLLSSGAAADVVIARSELTQLLERCEDVKQKLHRKNKVTAVEDLAMPWLLNGSKLTKQPTTLLDLCYGKTNNLNLQQVTGSEQRVMPGLEVENILAVLPAFPRGAALQRARRAAHALSRAANYSLLMAQQQVEALKSELDFHRNLYSLQVRTIEDLVQGIRQAYHTFQENIFHSLCAPLQDVLSCYEDLRASASEAALRRFLSAFKSSSTQIREAVEALGPSKSQGDEALAQYGHHFLQNVEALLKDCAEKREKASSQLHSLQEEQQQAIHTLNKLRSQRKETKTLLDKAHTPSDSSLSPSGQPHIAADQPHPACPECTQKDSPEAVALSGGSGDPNSRAQGKQLSQLSAQQRHRILRKALTVDVTSDPSKHGPSLPAGVNQRLRRRSSPLGKCSKVAARPDWQS
ncbi:protein lava lamp-like isoform X2 [Hoplias malabaricus]|uniref:protein lava lamp-like isoform X2 n=1 Tax=Hoplias malabaricus TaxID=27720 RepID=UPI003461D1F8